MRLREKLTTPTDIEDIERTIAGMVERMKLTPKEERVVAAHEAGHAVVSLFCPTSAPIERMSIQGDFTAGYVRHAERTHTKVMTMGQLLDDVCVLFGGREAEQLFFDDVSWGYGNDLSRATDIARALVEDYGLAGETVGMRRVELSSEDPVSEVTKAALDKAIAEILETQRKRAKDILTANKALVTTLRDLLVEKKVLDAAALATLLPSVPKKDPVASER